MKFFVELALMAIAIPSILKLFSAGFFWVPMLMLVAFFALLLYSIL